jgi:crotonobetainyl-CoA:carnitine CoA-transferase CaiB-like acyl-CoA transferase
VLNGLRVVELGTGLAGASCAAILRTLGATVRKFVPGASVPAFEPSLSTSSGGRVSILGDLLDRDKTTTNDGCDASVFSEADIVICDRVVDDAGLPPDPAEYAELVTRHNENVWVTATPFGLTGPYSSYLGSELVSSASGGLAATIAPKDGGRPSLLPGFQGLLATGQVAALAALHGLDRRRETDRSVHVDVSSQEAVALVGALPECAHAIYSCPGRAGSGRYVAPSGLFRCRDGLVRITAPDDHQWTGVVRALEAPGWTRGLEKREARAEHANRINHELQNWTAALAMADCAEKLQRHGVPATPVNTPDDLLASAQFAARGFFEGANLGGSFAQVPGRPYTWTPSADADAPAGPHAGLRGLRIAEFAHVLAGPIAGALLGAIGAHVVRFEDLARLDLYRRTGPFAKGIAGKERGAYFAVSNHSKHSLAVDVEAEPAAAAELVRRSDVVLENFGSARMARLGVAAESSTASRPELLFVNVSGFGQSGPLANYRAYANNVHAYGGLSHLTRDADGEPLHIATVLADPLSSLMAATVIAAWALGEHRRGGIVDLSMAEVVADKVAEFIAEASLGTTRTFPGGTDRFPYAPCGFHPTADDRWIAISVQSDDEWRALVSALGCPQALSDPAWATASRRWEARRTIGSALDEITRRAVAGDLFHRLQLAGVRACPVWSGADLIHDPHLQAREFFPRIDHPEPDLTEARLVGLAWRFVGEPAIRLHPPPRLGEYTLEGRRP